MTWARTEIIGDATLYLGKMEEVLPKIGRRAKALITDAPYRLTSGGKNGGLGGCLSAEEYGNTGEIVECEIEWDEWLPLAYAALEEQAQAWVMCNNRHVAAAQSAMEAAGFYFHNLAVWDKVIRTPNRWLMKCLEFAILGSKGKAYPLSDCSASQRFALPFTKESRHPNEKPVRLMMDWIELSTQPGDLVLDPFMGSGTTGVAAMRTGRGFVGVELDEDYYDLACRRVEAAQSLGRRDGSQRHLFEESA